MQSILDIKSIVYRLVNVIAVRSLINGDIYRGKAKDDSQTEDIEIVSLANVNAVVQEASIFVNCHFQNLADGQPDERKMKALAALLIPIFEANYSTTLIDEQVFMNNERPGWAYYSARILVNVLNDNFVE